MKLKHIAAALAVLAAGTANAAIATGGNGSLVMIAYDKLGGTTTAGVFDLGITMDDLIGATGNGSTKVASSLQGAGAQLSFNFLANTLSINGVVSTAYGNNNWTAAWNTLLANSDVADLQFVVTAFDNVGFGNAQRTIATGTRTPTAAQLDNSSSQATNMQLVSGGKFNDIFTPIQNKGTHGTAANGAYTFTAADGAATRANGYAMAGDGFANEWRNNNLLKGETFAGSTNGLWVLDGARAERLIGNVNLDVASGTLVMAVPEPSTYAMLIAGLALTGFVARRRRG